LTAPRNGSRAHRNDAASAAFDNTGDNTMTQARVVRLDATGAPEVMKVVSVELPAPASGEVRVAHAAIGFNFIDTYQRSGYYPIPIPGGLGFEASGTVEAIGPDVRDIAVGDRVAYMNAGVGAYASHRNVPADKLVKLPDAVSFEQAAALIFKGMTAQYLVRRTHRVQSGDIVLVHAAAGGVGQILSRWAKALGATVIGTAGSSEKCAAARAAGCDVAIDYTQDDWPQQVIDATGGKKARVVYDSVGKNTFLHSLDCAAPFGLVVLYGAASGPAPAIEPDLLNKKGCLFLTRPSVFPHNADPATFRKNAGELMEAIVAGVVSVPIGARYALDDVVTAHHDAEARRSTGSILLIP
jgi:NADPH2:quinone reductase